MGFIVNGINSFFYHKLFTTDIGFENLVKVYTRDKIVHIFDREESSIVNIEKSIKELSKEKLGQIIAIKIDKKLTYQRIKKLITKLDMINDYIFLLFKDVDQSITKKYINPNLSYSKVDMYNDIKVDIESDELFRDSQSSFMLFPNCNHRCHIIKTRNSCMKNTRTIVGEIWTNKLYEVYWYDILHQEYKTTYAKSINKENALRISHIEQRYIANYIDPQSEVIEMSLPDFLTYHQAIDKYGEEYEKDGDI